MNRCARPAEPARPLLRHAIYATYAAGARYQQIAAGESVNGYDDPRERWADTAYRCSSLIWHAHQSACLPVTLPELPQRVV